MFPHVILATTVQCWCMLWLMMLHCNSPLGLSGIKQLDFAHDFLSQGSAKGAAGQFSFGTFYTVSDA